MSLSAITFTVVDGGLGILPPDTGNLQVSIGCCSAGVPGTFYALGSLQSVTKYLGWGPLAEAVAFKMKVGATVQYAYVLPQTNAGALSAVSKFGTGYGVFTIASAPSQTITVVCTTAGALGTAAFTFALGAGTPSAPVVSASGWSSGYTVPGTSTSLAFNVGGGNPAIGDTFTISATGTVTNAGSMVITQVSQPFDQYEANVQIVRGGTFGSAQFRWALDYRTAPDGTDISNYSAPIIIPSAGKYAIPNSGIALTFAQPTVLVKITTGGALGTMQFDVNVAGGGYTGSPVTSNASASTSYAVAGTNTSIVFGTGVYVLNDVWTVSSVGGVTHSTGAGPGSVTQTSASFVLGDNSTFLSAPPSGSNTDVQAAGTALIADQTHQWSVAQIVGVPVSAGAAAAAEVYGDAFATAGFNAYRFFRVLSECPTVGSIVINTSLPIYDTADTDSVCSAAFASTLSTQGRTWVGAGDFDCVSPLTGRFQRRNAIWQDAARIGITPPKDDPGKTANGSLSFCRALYRDEAQVPALDAARLVTLRTYQGRTGFYITASPTMALVTSDFAQAPNCRVMDRACTVTYAALFPYLRTDVPVDISTGFIQEGWAQRIEGIVNGQLDAALLATAQVSGGGGPNGQFATISRNTNIISTGLLPWTVSIVPVGYAYNGGFHRVHQPRHRGGGVRSDPVADPILYPLIDGVRYSWASVKLTIGALQYLGCKSVNVNEKTDPAKIHGTGQNIIGTTAGMYDADGDIEFYQAEADQIVSSLGTGWMNKAVKVQVQYADDGQPIRTKVLSVRLTGRTQGGSEGSEASTSKFTMFFLAPVLDNGIAGVKPIRSILD